MTSLLLVASMLLLAAVLSSAWVELRGAYLQGSDKASLKPGPSECPAADTLPSDAERAAPSRAEQSASKTPSAAQPKPPAGQKTERAKRRRGGKR
ncbi:MAG: hypothetical protein RBU37_13240 [Myxococcota bacterium]|nr:hypothetical protein [Myxococcota bacterium]